MSDDLAKIDYSNREVIETIKATVAKDATDAQLAQFLEVCKSTGLNPFLKEVWCIPKMNLIMAGRDGYLRVANDHPQFDGMSTTVERDNNKIPIKATCTVYRKDRNHPIVCEAFYNEYKKNNDIWNKFPSAMISKVAEVLALKRSFAINGVVTEEEIGQEPKNVTEIKWKNGGTALLSQNDNEPLKGLDTKHFSAKETNIEYEPEYSETMESLRAKVSAKEDPQIVTPMPLGYMHGMPIDIKEDDTADVVFSEIESMKSVAKKLMEKVQALAPERDLDDTVRFLSGNEKASYAALDKARDVKKLDALIVVANGWLRAHELKQSGIGK